MTAQLCIMAKAPQPGRVKTRMQPQLSAEQAAAVAGVLISESVRRFRDGWRGPIALWAWPDTCHDIFQNLARRYDIALRNQPGGDLGYKMQTALEAGLANGFPAAVIGSDMPHVSADLLARAQSLLASGHPVYGPTCDGGFWLLGLTRPAPGLFDGVPWSSSRTGVLTLARARGMGVHFANLTPAVNDIDCFDDLYRAVTHDEPLRRCLFAGVTGLEAVLDARRDGTTTQ